MPDDNGVSGTIATVLLIGIMVVLAATVLSLLAQAGTLDPGAADRIQYLAISSVDHVSELPPHSLTYDSRITLIHRWNRTPEPGTPGRDPEERHADRLQVPTLNGHDFIPVHPHGIQWIGGAGTQGEGWGPGEEVEMDLTYGSFRPGLLAGAL